MSTQPAHTTTRALTLALTLARLTLTNPRTHPWPPRGKIRALRVSLNKAEIMGSIKESAMRNLNLQ